MVAIKTLAQLSLSRSSSQSSTPRSISSDPSPSTITMAVPVSRLAASQDYYLADDQLLVHRSAPRSKSAGAVSRNPDLGMSFTNPPSVKLSWPAPDPPPSPAPPPARKSKHNILVAPAAQPTVACGHAIQPTPHTSGAHRPLLSALLSVSTRATPAISRASSPPDHAPATPSTAPASGAKVQLQQLEASYVSKVSTRLKEFVNKVFPPTIENGLAFSGRTAPRPAAALDLGEALKHELTVSSSDAYISRAVLRTAVIPALTVYLGRLEPLLVPVSAHPTVLFVPKNAKEVDSALPLVLRFNIEVIRAAWVVRSAVEEICCAGSAWEGGVVPKVVLDGLSPFGAKLDALIQRFMAPYLVETKAQVMARISRFRIVEHQPNSLLHPSTVPHHKALPHRNTALGTSHAYSERVGELAGMLEAVRKLLVTRLACGSESRKWIVSVGSQAVWKAMLAFAARPASQVHLPSTVILPTLLHHPDSSSSISASGLKGARHILRGGGPKRSPSPPLTPEYVFYNELANEVKAFSNIINLFVKDIAGLDTSVNNGVNERLVGCVDNNHLGCEVEECVFCGYGFMIHHGDGGDGEDGEEEDIVRDAMNEALEAFSAFQLVLFAISLHPLKLLSCLSSSSSSNSNILQQQEQQEQVKKEIISCKTLKSAIEELPPVILLHCLCSRIEGFLNLPHLVWWKNHDDNNLNNNNNHHHQSSWEDYDSLLKGFGTAEIWCEKIGFEMLKEWNRLKQVQQKEENVNGSSGPMDVYGQILEVVCRDRLGIWI